MFKTIFFIAIGGAFGSVFRYLTAVFVNKYWNSNFPLATFLTNFVGCFLIGLAVGFVDKYYPNNSDLKWFLVTGFCGGFTTFSAFGFENVTLLQNQNVALSFLYIGASIFCGIFSVWLGLFVSK